MKCKTCNTWNVNTAKYCRNCGKRLSTPPKNNFSSNTSTANGTTSVNKQSSSVSSTSSDDSNVLKWIATIIIVILCIGAVMGGYTAPLLVAGWMSIKKIWGEE